MDISAKYPLDLIVTVKSQEEYEALHALAFPHEITKVVESQKTNGDAKTLHRFEEAAKVMKAFGKFTAPDLARGLGEMATKKNRGRAHDLIRTAMKKGFVVKTNMRRDVDGMKKSCVVYQWRDL